jgi:hypothetical protein
MHLIMRNPIWTGWRVIDKKRDTSAAGRYPSIDGRQADRRKIARAPEEIIRVKVIADPMVSDSDFEAVQRIMDLKQLKHWRAQPEIEHRFTYNGFLTCADCGEVIHTAFARRDYYACKGRRTAHVCKTKYMAREKLETALDSMFADQLTSREFLEDCLQEMNRRQEHDDCTAQIQRLISQVKNLKEKRARVMDAFFDGSITREERNSRISTIDRDAQAAEDLLAHTNPAGIIDLDLLVDSFAPLLEWEYWSRDQKRSVLATIVPDIRVANYHVASLGLHPAIFSKDDTRTDRDSWPRRA